MERRLAVPSKELQLKIIGPRDIFAASRVQRLTLASTQPSTTVDELGNPLHVGEVKDTPEVTLTFSAFDVGIKIFGGRPPPGGGPGVGSRGGGTGGAARRRALYVKDTD